MKQLNTRQFKLYELLKNNYADGKYISKQEICELLPQYYTYNADTNRHNTDIEYDVRAINDSMYMQKAIVSNKYGYKIGNEAECNEYLNRRFKSLGNSFKSLWNMKKRLEQNGQMKLTFDTQERDTIISFITDENR